jgi:hypothetical protein
MAGLDNAQISGLGTDARRTEIVRARNAADTAAEITSLQLADAATALDIANLELADVMLAADIVTAQMDIDGFPDTLKGGAQTAATITPASPWTGNLYTLRTGNVVTLVIFVDRASVTINGTWTLGTVPVGYRPTYGSVYFPVTYLTSTAGSVVSQTTWASVNTTGAIEIRARIENAVALRGGCMWLGTP